MATSAYVVGLIARDDQGGLLTMEVKTKSKYLGGYFVHLE